MIPTRISWNWRRSLGFDVVEIRDDRAAKRSSGGHWRRAHCDPPKRPIRGARDRVSRRHWVGSDDFVVIKLKVDLLLSCVPGLRFRSSWQVQLPLPGSRSLSRIEESHTERGIAPC